MRLREASTIVPPSVHKLCPRSRGAPTIQIMMRSCAPLLLAAGLLAVESAQPPRFDVLIRNARVMDGTGNPWLRADLGITADRITAVGRLSGAMAARTIDARDRI